MTKKQQIFFVETCRNLLPVINNVMIIIRHLKKTPIMQPTAERTTRAIPTNGMSPTLLFLMTVEPVSSSPWLSLLMKASLLLLGAKHSARSSLKPKGHSNWQFRPK